MIVKLPKGVFVDLYDATSVTVGNVLAVTNVAGADVQLFATAAEPVTGDDFFPCLFRHNTVNNELGDAGAWAICYAGGAVDAREVV